MTILLRSRVNISLLLASASPRRQELIALLGLPFAILPAHVDEESVIEPDPVATTLAIARLKGRRVAAMMQDAANGHHAEATIIVAADTTVVIDGRLLGKPATPAEATAMLRLLRGRTHAVHTALMLINKRNGREAEAVQTSHVTMRTYSDAEMAAYVDTGDPLDKAGAYAIQHPVFRPVAQLTGCYTGVMGLSLCQLIQMLRAWDVPVAAPETAVAQAHQQYPCPLLAEIYPTSRYLS